MRYRKLDANGDYTFGSGSSCFISDHDAVVQAIVTRLKLWSMNGGKTSKREFLCATCSVVVI